MRWLDAARGIGIVLVVYAHGARALPDVLHHDIFQDLDKLIYSFHMPLFFFLAGLVSTRPLERSRRLYLSGKFTTVVYPYLLWSVIYWVLETLFASRVNSPLDHDAILWVWWTPVEHLWFLYVLFFCQLLSAILWPRVVLLVFLGAWMLLGPLPPINVPAFWTQFPWFVAGLLSAPLLLHGSKVPAVQAGVGLALGAPLALLTAAILGEFEFAALAKFSTAGVGITLTVAAAYLARGSRILTYLGEASLSIYLLHTIFSAGTRELLEIVFPVDELAMLAITVVAGIVMPLMVHEAARRTGFASYLGLGKIGPGIRDDVARSEQPARS